MSTKITIDIISFDTKTPSKAVFSITPSANKPPKQINSEINYLQNPPDVWASKVTITASPPDPRIFDSQFTSKLTNASDAVNSTITGKYVSNGTINCTISPDPNNKTGAIVKNNNTKESLPLKQLDQNSFTLGGLIFRSEYGKNRFIITYNRIDELNALAAAMSGSVFNGSSSNTQDVMAGHLACILGQFRTLFP
jgi:hypothetical protein